MRPFCILGLAALLLAAWLSPDARAQTRAGAPRIEWEVKNRFRLFRSEADFDRHVAAYRNDGVLGAEERLARDSDGRGWARDVVERLCVDRAGKLMEFCDRDGGREVYLAPREHPIGVVLAGPIPANVSCAWSFDDGEGEPRRATVPCDEEIKLRVAYGRPTLVSVDIVLPDSTAQRVVTEIGVRDVLIAGLGDSIAAGEGNPDRPAFSQRWPERILPACPRRLYREQILRRRWQRKFRRRQLGAPERALGERALPPLAL